MTVRELIDLMDEKESICIEDIDKQIDNMELYCGNASGLNQDNPIMDMEIIGIVAVNDLICAAVTSKEKWYENLFNYKNSRWL